MIVLCKYTKLGSASLLPHLDVMRCIMMAIRRSGIKVKFSEGYNPHMQLYFNQPLPLGIESQCEYFYAITDLDAKTFIKKLNSQMREGISIVKAINLNGDPKIAKNMRFADYLCTMRDITYANIVDKEINKLLKSNEYTVTIKKRNDETVKEIRNMVKDIKKLDDLSYCFTLSCGNENLRADVLINEMLSRNNVNTNERKFNIIKTNTYDLNGSNIDELFN